MSKIEVNAIEPQCGTTLTLGGSGDTVTLGSGASQTGFGRTGTVNWQTTKKTANFTAVSGEGYFVDTSGGAITATLPASPSAGDIVSFADYTRTFNTNNLTLGRNSEPIGGIAADGKLSTDGQAATFIYIDGTEGWINTSDSTGNTGAVEYMSATGGTITTCGDFKVHTFTSPGTFTVTASTVDTDRNKVAYMVVAGGAGGGFTPGSWGGGGGGAGGFREGRCSTQTPYTASPIAASSGITTTSQAYPITVGAGGAAGSSGSGPSGPTSAGAYGCGSSGSNSIFSTITSAGGGFGGGGQPGAPNPSSRNNPGGPGGSGGGAASGYFGGSCGPSPVPGGTGNTPPVSPAQGQNGGAAASHVPANSFKRASGGGGGATAAGSSSPTGGAGAGGAGATTSISGSPTAYAGGGGGGGAAPCSPSGASGGTGGGGGGSPAPSPGTATAGSTNTGGGGGGGGGTSSSGAAGGSGVVVIRYKFQ